MSLVHSRYIELLPLCPRYLPVRWSMVKTLCNASGVGCILSHCRYEMDFTRLVLTGACFTWAIWSCVSCAKEASVSVKLPTLGVGILDIKTHTEKENALVLALNAGYRMVDIWEG